MKTFIITMLGFIFITCEAPKTSIDKYVQYQKYSPAKTLSYRFRDNRIEFILPDQYKSQNRYISFFLKDTVTGAYMNSHDKYNTNNNIVRIDLDYDLQDTNNFELSSFFTWDDDFWVFGCCQIMRFYYLPGQKGTLVYEPTCRKDTFYTFDNSLFKREGNPPEELEIRRFVIRRLTCD